MARWSPRAVLDWLRAGYPDGIPAKDHFALLAVLKRRLTDEEILEAIDTAAATAAEHPERHVDHDTLRKIVAGLIHEEPAPEDIERVREQLVAAGWPVVDDELSRGETEEPDSPDDDHDVPSGSSGDAPTGNYRYRRVGADRRVSSG